MSTYYFLVCEQCGERCPACSSVADGCNLGDSAYLLPRFIYAHRNCGSSSRPLGSYSEGGLLAVVSEHDVDEADTKWTIANAEELSQRARAVDED